MRLLSRTHALKPLPIPRKPGAKNVDPRSRGGGCSRARYAYRPRLSQAIQGFGRLADGTGEPARVHRPSRGRHRSAGDPSRRYLPFRRGDRGARASQTPCQAAATRQGSVRAGLEALSAQAPAIVLVHDAARPFTSQALVSRAIASAVKHGAAVPGLPVTDTVKLIDNESLVASTLDRSHLRTVQTPQAFAYPMLLDAHRRAAAAGRDDFPDDAALVEWAGMKVAIFEGETRKYENDDGRGFRTRRARGADGGRAISAPASATTSMRSTRRRSCVARRREDPARAQACRPF